jgi:phospholipid/cholesterol/gamma-HCH transport system permease protein
VRSAARLAERLPGLTGALESLGDFAALVERAVATLVRRAPRLDAVVGQLDAMGVRSVSVAALTAIFSCMVVAVQFTFQMARFGAQDYVGMVVSVSQIRELGPVLTALIAGGRIGAGITAELGSMQVTEQIDAIRSMGGDPVRQLVVPRLLAGAVALPVLTVLADIVGIASAMAMARLESGVRVVHFYRTSLQEVQLGDLLGGLGKATFFGVLIALVACHLGLRARGGTEGVGRATTRAVVVTSVTTLAADFAITKALMLFGV